MDKSLPLEAAGQKSCSFCTGREPESNSRGQGQEGDGQEPQGIFRISFSDSEFHPAVSVLTRDEAGWPF